MLWKKNKLPNALCAVILVGSRAFTAFGVPAVGASGQKSARSLASTLTHVLAPTIISHAWDGALEIRLLWW